MRPSAVVEFGSAKITIGRATGLVGMQRSLLAYRDAEKNRADEPEANKIFRSITYPDLVAPVLSAEGTVAIFDDQGEEIQVDLSQWPPTLEEVMQFPDELIYTWESAVYQLNPHWDPAARARASEAQKKEPSSPGA